MQTEIACRNLSKETEASSPVRHFVDLVGLSSTELVNQPDVVRRIHNFRPWSSSPSFVVEETILSFDNVAASGVARRPFVILSCFDCLV